MRNFLALMSLLISVPALADQKLVADCYDDVTSAGYRVYQDTTDASGLGFTAESVKGGWKAAVDLLILDEGTVAWASGAHEGHMFVLSIDRQSSSEAGYNSLLATDGYEGHIRCQLSL